MSTCALLGLSCQSMPSLIVYVCVLSVTRQSTNLITSYITAQDLAPTEDKRTLKERTMSLVKGVWGMCKTDRMKNTSWTDRSRSSWACGDLRQLCRCLHYFCSISRDRLWGDRGIYHPPVAVGLGMCKATDRTPSDCHMKTALIVRINLSYSGS